MSVLVADTNEHVIKPLVPDDMGRPKEFLAVFFPVRHHGKRLFLPGGSRQFPGGDVQELVTGVLEEIKRQRMRSTEITQRKRKKKNFLNVSLSCCLSLNNIFPPV